MSIREYFAWVCQSVGLHHDIAHVGVTQDVLDAGNQIVPALHYALLGAAADAAVGELHEATEGHS